MVDDAMTAQRRCPVCLERDLQIFFELHGVPVYYHLLCSSREAAVSVPRGEIRLGFCRACGMIYNYAYDPSLMPQTEGYENSQFFSPHFQAYARELAAQLVERYHLYGKDILDIGCGPGGLLALLCEGARNRGVAFDPYAAAGTESWEVSAPITFIRDYYSEAYAENMGDLVICRHILEHFHDPRDFLCMLRRAIGDRDSTVAFFEVPNMTWILDTTSSGDIFYEHCSYFSTPSLARLFQETGYEILALYPAFHEQVLCLEARPARAASPPSMEASEGLQALARQVAIFEECYRQKFDLWNTELNRLCEQRSRIVVWGAGSKGISFVNTVKAAHEISYVVDINPHKQGKYVVGTGQQIVPPDFLRGYQPDTVLVMNSAYKDEISEWLGHLKVSADVISV
ncbi:MAG TPA: class I SAM-dependent methyltransferase [Alphaproteobacteria bacterium]|nr:class I SAM-dependent methyltransferase [Alphaproteobacteria bacterium]